MGLNMAFGLRNKDWKTIQGILKDRPFIRGAKVFGSRALGRERRDSDMDLAVSAPEATAEEWQELCEALEQAPVVFDVDLLRFEESTPRGLVEKISLEGRDFFSP
jgi:predicted nucleotidyltransferase